ncbi:hypothetical protein Vadar_031873 [Vaccinium darrowii]|uniref:Uncharacterized protein n=1 Tax=Vaccinium darrowii TaxID=229202 RepID=A0ACB7YHE7_9ERIC|nr:hypothetical protein Vadar_031873 [Vaccinium darrowii]
MADPKFKVGMIFPTRNNFKAALKEHAIRTRKLIKFIKNDSERVRAVCKGKKCSWVLLAPRMQGSESFQVKTYVPTHNCKRVFHNKHVTSKWLSKQYVEALRSNPSWPVKSFKDQVQKDHKVGVSRAQLYKAKALALKMIEGDFDKQYAKLPDYCEELRRTNPDTTVILKTTEDAESGGRQRFERLYVCLGGCKKGFLAGCRLVIGLDGCHLKGPYKGQLLIAVGVDGNNQSYVVSYAIVEAENKASWKWFTEILAEDLHIGTNFTFISDKQKGLITAIAEVVPYAEHRFCIRHFYNNFKETNKGLHLKEILFSAAKATYVAQFNFHMQELHEADEAALTWLNDHPPMHWSRSHFCTFSNCEILDNMCESFNDTILEARAIHECNEDVDEYVAHWFRKETYMASYKPMIYPLNGMDMWTPTGVIGPLPPDVKKQAGRPKKLRKRGNDEPRESTTLKRRNTTTTCSQCGKLGHNKRSCKGQPIPKKQTGRRSNLALGRNAAPESSSQAQQCGRQGAQKGSQATMGTPRQGAGPKSLSQPTMGTPTRRSQRQAQQSSTQPLMGSTRGRKKGPGARSK